MYKLVISDDEGKTTVVPLVRDEITIGRKEGNTIRLTERNVSRRHAKLTKANGAFLVEDLASYNGIKVNGRKIAGATPLKAGDQLIIGDYQLALQVDGATAAPELPTAPTPMIVTADAATAMIAAPSAPVPPARLVMLTPPAPGAEFALTSPRVRLGRAEDLDIWVNHRSISREHAEVTQDDGRYVVHDVGSANGLRVNGHPRREWPLDPGDVLELGQVRFRFVGEGEDYVFDADRTLQMEAVAGPGPVSRLPILAALAIIGVAVIVAGVVVLGGDDEPDQPLVTNIVETDPGIDRTGGAPAEPAAPVLDDAVLAEALASCRSALADRRFRQAASFGAAALRLSPTSEQATTCKTAAERGQQEQEQFERGRALLSAGQIDEAHFAFEELPEDSTFRDEEDVRRAATEFAQAHLRLAEAALSDDAAEADRQATMVLNAASMPPEMIRDARRIQQRARRRAVQVASAAQAGQDRGQTQTAAQQGSTAHPAVNDTASAGTAAAAPAADPIARCRQVMASGGDFNRCIITALDGRARSARDLDMLITTHRAMGNMPAALRYMCQYVQRFPDGRSANNYRQILAAHGRSC